MTTVLIIFSVLLFLAWFDEHQKVVFWQKRTELFREAYKAVKDTDATQQLHLARERIDQLERERAVLHALLLQAAVERKIVESIHMIRGYAVIAFWN